MMQIENSFFNDEPAQPPLASGNAANIARIARKLLVGSPVIIASAVMFCLLADWAIQEIPAKYTSSTSILIDPRRPGAYGAGEEFTNIFVDEAKIASVQEVLLSSDILTRVVRSNHLADDPAFGNARLSLLDRFAPVLSPAHSDPVNTPAAREARAVDQLRRRLGTTRVAMTYVIRIEATAATSAQAQQLAKAVADAYINDQIDMKLDAVQRDSAWLTQRMQAQREDLIRSEVAVEDIRKKFGITGSDSAPDSTVERQSVTEINQELVKAEGDVAVATARYEQAQRAAQTGGGLEGLTDVTTSKVVSDLRKQQAEAAQRISDLSARYASDYPARRQVEQGAIAVNRQISLEVSRIVASLRNDYETALAHRDSLQHQLTGMIGLVNAAANAAGRVELREAERVAEANRIAYEASLNKLKEVEQQQTRQDVEARVISEAERPDRPSFPKPAIFLTGGAVLGAGFGALGVLLFSIGRGRVEDAVSAERDLLLPVLTMTPYLTGAILRGDGTPAAIPEYLVRNPFSQFAESLRRVRLQLTRSKSPGARIVQVTSAVQAEGKSTIAAGIAISAAMAGMRTVLVDLDFHHPAAGKLLGYEQSEGVVDVLLGTVGPVSALRDYADLPIRVINAGSVHQLNPAMIESKQLRTMIAELAQDADFVVLDTPPVLAISDPLFVSGLVDATIMVVAWKATPSRCVDDALTALRSAGAPLTGIVLNKVGASALGRRGNYQYGYTRYAET